MNVSLQKILNHLLEQVELPTPDEGDWGDVAFITNELRVHGIRFTDGVPWSGNPRAVSGLDVPPLGFTPADLSVVTFTVVAKDEDMTYVILPRGWRVLKAQTNDEGSVQFWVSKKSVDGAR